MEWIPGMSIIVHSATENQFSSSHGGSSEAFFWISAWLFFIHHAINMSTCFWRCHESEVKWILWREESIWGGNLCDLNPQRNCRHLVNKGQGTLKWWKLVLKPLTISLFLLQDSWSFSSITEAHLTLTLLEVSEQYCFSLLLVFKYLRIKLPPGLLLPQKGA